MSKRKAIGWVLLAALFVALAAGRWSGPAMASPPESLSPARLAWEGCPDPYESNDGFAEAITLVSGNTYASYSCNSDDQDYWKIRVTAGQEMVIDLFDMQINSDLYLYGPEQNQVDESQRAGSAAEQIRYTPAVSGWHWVKVSWYGYGGPDVPNPYKLRVVVAGGVRIYGRVVDHGSGLGLAGADVRLYRQAGDWTELRQATSLSDGAYSWWINPVAGQYRIVAQPPAGYRSSTATYPPDVGAWLVNEDTVEFTLPERDAVGEFVFRVQPIPTVTATPSHTPTPTSTSTVVGTPTRVCAPDQCEPNDSVDQGYRITMPFFETDLVICTPDDDWFTFEARGGQTLWSVIQFDDRLGDLSLVLTDRWGGYLATGAQQGGVSQLTYRVPVTASLRIHVFRVGAGSYRIPYDLAIQQYLGSTPTPTSTRPPATATPTPTVEPKPVVDLSVWEMEIIQTLQNLDNDVPLVRGKRTYARVYVDTDGPLAAPVKGWIEATNLAGSRLSPAQVPFTNEVSVKGLTNSLAVQRNSLDGALFAVLPDSWVAMVDSIAFTAHVTCDEIDDPNPANNSKTVGLYVADSPPVHIQAVQVLDGGFLGIDAIGPGFSDYEGINLQAQRLYPANTVTLHPHTRSTLWFGDNCTISNLWFIDILDRDPGPNTIIMGMVRNVGLTKWGGMGNASGLTWVVVTPGYTEAMGSVAAHEMGHGFGLWHVNACNAGWPFEDYPYPLEWLSNGGVRDYYGLDPKPKPVLLLPQTTGDLMSYCHPRWPSDYTNTKLSNTLRSNAGMTARSATLQADTEYLVVVGTIATADDTVTLLPLVRLPGADLDPRPSLSAAGEYAVRLLDGAGAVLGQETFDAGGAPHEEEAAAFGLVLPYQPGTQRVVVVKGEQELASQPVSAHAPSVALQAIPSPITDPLDVRWLGSDADGDDLTASLFYSADDGEHWDPVMVGITATQALLDTSHWAGSEHGRLRVLVTDGVNTGTAMSNAFTVPLRPPLVSLTSPATGSVLPLGQPLALAASAWDAEDGPLTGAALSWGSSQDGELGTGESLLVWHPSPGWHTLTVIVTDSDGLASSASVGIFLGGRVVLPRIVKG